VLVATARALAVPWRCKTQSLVVDGRISGHVVNHLRLDPRDWRNAAGGRRTGTSPHVFRSTNLGAVEGAAQRPLLRRRRRVSPRDRGPHLLAHAGTPGQRDTWYAGTSPQGLFRSETAA